MFPRETTGREAGSRAAGPPAEGSSGGGRDRAHLVDAHDRDAAQAERRAGRGNLERGTPGADPTALAVLDRRLEDVSPRRKAEGPLDHARPLPRDLELGERALDRRIVAEPRHERARFVLDLGEQAHVTAVRRLASGESEPGDRHLDPHERLGPRLPTREAQGGGAVLDVVRHRRGGEGLGEGQLVRQHHRGARRQRVVAAAGADDDAGAGDLDRDGAPAAVGLRGGRNVADLVVRAQVGHHALEPGAEVVRLGHEEPTRALREVP